MTAVSSGTGHTLSAFERKKLAAILAMLSSDYEQERATAGLMATNFIRRHNLTWHDVAALAGAESRTATSAGPGSPAADRPRLMMQERWTADRACWSGYDPRTQTPSGRVLDRLI